MFQFCNVPVPGIIFIMLQMYHNIVLQTWKAFVSTRRVIQDDDTRQITVDGRQIFGEASSIHFTMLGGNNKIISSLIVKSTYQTPTVSYILDEHLELFQV